MPGESALSALAGRNRITCDECGEILKTQKDTVRAVRWGFWSEEKQWFDRRPHSEHYCPSCWRHEFGRETAAHYVVPDGETLWNILAGADGGLVADLRPVLVGGRLWIRVRDDELEGMRSTREAVREGGKNILRFGSEPAEIDREWFEQFFRAEQDLPDDHRPTLVLLKPTDETPFSDVDELHPDQTRLTDD